MDEVKNEELERAYQDLSVALHLKVTYEPSYFKLYGILTIIQAAIVLAGLIMIAILVVL